MTPKAANPSPRERLLRAAARLFREKGYERTTVRDIAAVVGIQSGSIFHHFRSKDEILFAVMRDTILVITAEMEAALEGLSSPEDELLALIRCELGFILGDRREAMSVLVYEWRSLSEPRQQEILGLRDHYENLWMQAFAKAEKAGLLVAEPFVLRRFMTGALSWTVTWFRPNGKVTLEELAEKALLLVIKKT